MQDNFASPASDTFRSANRRCSWEVISLEPEERGPGVQYALGCLSIPAQNSESLYEKCPSRLRQIIVPKENIHKLILLLTRGIQSSYLIDHTTLWYPSDKDGPLPALVLVYESLNDGSPKCRVAQISKHCSVRSIKLDDRKEVT